MNWLKRRRVEEETRRLQRALGLGLWTIRIEWGDEDDVLARAYPTDSSLSAVIVYMRQTLDLPWREQRHVVLHELVHLMHQELVEAVRLTSEVPMDDVLRAVLDEAFRNREERFVDLMSRVLLPLV